MCGTTSAASSKPRTSSPSQANAETHATTPPSTDETQLPKLAGHLLQLMHAAGRRPEIELIAIVIARRR
uniref:Uncharacterized protein n=1 Tax=Oryza rufipogon TaxID=4529 RepID=A0A0E0QG13_ORYRU